jgi:hypothetical protein
MGRVPRVQLLTRKTPELVTTSPSSSGLSLEAIYTALSHWLPKEATLGRGFGLPEA